MMTELQDMLGLTIEGLGSDADGQFYLELSDGTEVEFIVNDEGELEVFLYSGYLDS